MFKFYVMTDYEEVVSGNRSYGFLYQYVCEKLNYVLESTYGVSLKELYHRTVDFVTSLNSDFLNFDDFQLKILKVFLTVLLINLILIIFLWNAYKDRIYERFIQPGKIINFPFCKYQSKTERLFHVICRE